MENNSSREFLIKNNHGFTLVGVLMVLVVLSILGISIIAVASNSLKASSGERNDQSVFYIAEAGVVEKVNDINIDVEEAFRSVKKIYDQLSIKNKETFDFVGRFYSEVVSKVDLSPQIMSAFEPNFGSNPSASITVTQKSTNPPIYEIKSIGNIDGKIRTVTQELTIFLEPSIVDDPGGIGGPGLSERMALFVKKSIELGGSVKIHGDAGIQSKNIGDTKFSGGGAVTGEVIRGIENFIDLPPFPSFPSYTIPADQEIKNSNGNKTNLVKDGKLLINNYITNGYTLNMNNDLEYKEIHLNENNTLTINVANADRIIVVDHLNVTNGHIKITGTGKLTIYVKNKITMGSASTMNDNTKDVQKLQIYQKGSNSINLAGGQKIYGSLYAEQSDINITGGGGFQGDIYTGGKNIYVGGGTSVNTQLFLAPNAKFVLGEGGHIKGLVIADSFIGTGGGSVTYNGTSFNPGSGGSMKDYGNGANLIKKAPLVEK